MGEPNPHPSPRPGRTGPRLLVVGAAMAGVLTAIKVEERR